MMRRRRAEFFDFHISAHWAPEEKWRHDIPINVFDLVEWLSIRDTHSSSIYSAMRVPNPTRGWKMRWQKTQSDLSLNLEYLLLLFVATWRNETFVFSLLSITPVSIIIMITFVYEMGNVVFPLFLSSLTELECALCHFLFDKLHAEILHYLFCIIFQSWKHK